MESFIFSPWHRLYFHHALWTFIYFTHFPTKIFISKILQAPSSILFPPLCNNYNVVYLLGYNSLSSFSLESAPPLSWSRLFLWKLALAECPYSTKIPKSIKNRAWKMSNTMPNLALETLNAMMMGCPCQMPARCVNR